MDRSTYRLAQAIEKRRKLVADLAAHDAQLNAQLREWSDSRPNAVGGGTATLAGATFILTQAGVLTKPKG
jgi:hypothetical protein